MDTLGEIFQYVILMDDAAFLDWRTFFVTLPAEERNFQRRGWRIIVLHGQDIVRAVAVVTVRCQWITLRKRLPVKRLRVEFLFTGMARAAIDLFQVFLVREFLPFQIGVTVNATQRSVNRTSKFLFVDKN